jgi:hypothetical protein
MSNDLIARLSPAFRARFAVTRLLGQGGMGTVVLAQDTALARPVAVKLLFSASSKCAETALKRFEREAQSLAKMSHPGLVKVYATGVDGAAAYIVFEYVEGESYESVLSREATLPPARVTAMALDVLGGLEALHAAGIVHRDIKPGNLMATAQGAKIIDLGIAQMAQVMEELTPTGKSVGTPSFVAPEQVRDSTVGPAADLYSLGAVMFFALTGGHAFKGSGLQMIALKMKTDPPPIRSVADVPQPLAGVVDRLLAREPAARPQSADEVRKQLTAAAPRRTTGRVKVVAAPAATPAPRRWPLAVAGLAAIGALAAFALKAAPPTLGAPVVEPRARSVVARFARTPPGPAELAVTVTGKDRKVLAATESAAEHRFVLADLEPGDAVTVQPLAGGVAGPVASFNFQPVSALDVRVAWKAGAMQVRFATALPVVSRFQARTARGETWSAWDPSPTTSHALELPAREMPISARILCEHKLGDEVATDRPALGEDARLAYLEGAAGWFVDAADVVHKKLFDRAGALETGQGSIAELSKAVGEAQAGLAPEWFLEDLGGANGVLDHPKFDLDRKDRFYRAVWVLEMLEAVAQLYKLPGKHPLHALYGAHFGPSAAPRYPKARRLPLEVPPGPLSDGFHLMPHWNITDDPEFASRKDWTHEITSKLVLSGIGPSTRAELAARARVKPGRAIHVLVNGKHLVRLTRPDRAFPSDKPAELFAAFDARYLENGENTFAISCPVMPGFLEELEIVHGVRIEKDGLSLRVTP